MNNFEQILIDFHDNHVTLSLKLRADMRRKRDANLSKLKHGLEDNKKPCIIDTINQGGYAMKTMTQPPEGDEESRYDIDLGVVFAGDEVSGPKTTKNWVCEAIALKAGNMKNDPLVKPKCIRVTYSDGYQVDFPVFKSEEHFGYTKNYLATNDEWIESDPERFNKWFEKSVSERSPNSEGTKQLRLIVRLIKYFCKVQSHKDNLKYPAGLTSTAIAVECYSPSEHGLHISFQQTLENIGNRLSFIPVTADGVVVSTDKDIQRISRLIEAAGKAGSNIKPLTTSDDEYDNTDVKSILKKIFRHSFFDTSGEKMALETKSLFGALSTTGLSSSAAASSRDELIVKAKNDIINNGGYKKPWTSSNG